SPAAARDVDVPVGRGRRNASRWAAPPVRPRAFGGHAKPLVKPPGNAVFTVYLKHGSRAAARPDHVQARPHQPAGDALSPVMGMNGDVGDYPGISQTRRPVGRINRDVADDFAILFPDVAEADTLRQFVNAGQHIQSRANPAERPQLANGRAPATVHAVVKGHFDQIGQRRKVGTQVDRPRPGGSGCGFVGYAEADHYRESKKTDYAQA